MNRKQFIEKLGATCNNWYWSWSFVNSEAKTIIFGAWDDLIVGGSCKIFTYDWEYNHKGVKNKGFKQSREHIRLIEEEGYKLLTFTMYYSGDNKDERGEGPAKIGDFEESVFPKRLIRRGNDWYAIDIEEQTFISEEIDPDQEYYEGTKSTITVNTYERNIEARERCIEKHGCYCSVCGFDFEEKYGLLGAEYIHVHHLYPLHKIQKEYKVCPEKDLIPVCANCHAMIHKGRNTISIEELKTHIEKAVKLGNGQGHERKGLGSGQAN